MRTEQLTLFLSILISTLCACTNKFTPFSQSVVSEFNLTDNELKKLQFYISDDIILRRSVTEGKSDISNGVLRTHRGRQVEEIRIRRGTPGVYLYRRGENHLAVSFEESGRDLYLMFGPNPKLSNRYVLLASDWNHGIGYVTYGGRQYETESYMSYLTVDLRQRDQLYAKRRTAGGRRIE